ncbi:MAG: DUF2490 domain-containing protein [Chitinophagaceae bacterium]
MRNQLLLLIFIVLTVAGWSQTRHETWVRVNFNHWINEKIGLGLELHHRRQSNFLKEEINLLDKPMLNIVRPWFYYRGLKKYVLTISPISFHDYNEIADLNGNLNNFLEIRSTYGIQRNFNFKNVTNRNRIWYELRFTDVNSANRIFQTRLRIQNSLLFPLWTITGNTKLNYNFTNEFFVNQKKDLVNFDHNRFFNGVQLKKRGTEINFGYQWSLHHADPRAYSRHQLFLNTSFDL